MQDKIQADLKTALLAGDKTKAETLKAIKNALQYEAVAMKSVDRSLNEEQIQTVLARESKKRQDAAMLYQQNNAADRAEAELDEKKIIDSYLPEQLDEQAISKVVDEEITKLDNPTMADMGKVIGAVKAKLGATADGATIAHLVKSKLQ